MSSHALTGMAQAIRVAVIAHPGITSVQLCDAVGAMTESDRKTCRAMVAEMARRGKIRKEATQGRRMLSSYYPTEWTVPDVRPVLAARRKKAKAKRKKPSIAIPPSRSVTLPPAPVHRFESVEEYLARGGRIEILSSDVSAVKP